MQALNSTQLTHLTQDAEVLEADGLGPKVYRLKDTTILKVFRRRPWWSGGSLWPYAKRFATNAQSLRKRGFITPEIIATYSLDDPVNTTAVHYRALPGITLRKALQDAQLAQKEKYIEALGHQFAKLHQQGVYFRSAHLGNFLLMPDSNLGIIDLADLRLSYWPLSNRKRARNLRHICRYTCDRQWLFNEHLEAFLRGYGQAAPKKIAGLRQAIRLLPT